MEPPQGKSIDEQFRRALALHQAGQFQDALNIYVAILRSEPRHFDSLHLLGVAMLQIGNPQKSVELIELALQISPNVSAACNNLANAYKELGHFDKAIAFYQRSIELEPDYADAHYNLGTALKEAQQLAASLQAFDQAIALNPQHFNAYSNRGNVLQDLGRIADAIASYDKAVALHPRFADAFSNRGNAYLAIKDLDAAVNSYQAALALQPEHADALYNCGTVLKQQGQTQEAIAMLQKAIAIRPHHADSHNNLGNAFLDLKQPLQALQAYDRAIAHKATNAESYYNRGNALKDLRRFPEAVDSYSRALSLKPQLVEALSNRGNAYMELTLLDAAIADFNSALQIQPDLTEALWNKGLTLLTQGNYQSGWPLYESRWKREDIKPKIRPFQQPLWLEQQDLRGKTLLLHAEQGLGDTLQFCRLASLVRPLGARVLLEVQKPLTKLMQQLPGVDALYARGDQLPPFDFQCPLLSLPLALGIQIDAIPFASGYLKPSTESLAHWTAQLGSPTRPRVGLVWSGSTGHRNDRNRSLLFEQIARALPDGIDYFCLQKEIRETDRDTLTKDGRVRLLDTLIQDFTDTAALCSLMDLVVSVDTSVAHLAGALGQPVCVLLPWAPDWRWMLYRKDTPWYQSMELLRQPTLGDWEGALSLLRNRLEKLTP